MKRIVIGPPFEPESQSTVTEFEKRFHVTLPDDYRAFMTTCGGGIADPATNYIDAEAHRDLHGSVIVNDFMTLARMVKALNDYSGRIPEGMLPFADNFFGDLLRIGVTPKTAGIYFWDHEEEDLGYLMLDQIPLPDRVAYFKIAPSFRIFSEMLVPSSA